MQWIDLLKNGTGKDQPKETHKLLQNYMQVLPGLYLVL